mgnify:CR=1 FL=1
MNGMLVQLVASGAALSLMGGAVTVHYVHVQEVSSAFDGDASPEGIELASLETTSELMPGEAMVQTDRAPETRPPSEKEVTLELLQSMVDQIESLANENRALRLEQSALEEQVAESNRDLSQLKFRVDTHSESFRPLRVSEDSVLRPLNSTHPVLPPKDWTSASQGASGWPTAGQ